MTRPISARTRADAIAICEQRHADPMAPRMLVSDTAAELGVDTEFGAAALRLAFDAWRAVPQLPYPSPWTWYWLEASGILRDGWCPSGWDVVAKAATP